MDWKSGQLSRVIRPESGPFGTEFPLWGGAAGAIVGSKRRDQMLPTITRTRSPEELAQGRLDRQRGSRRPGLRLLQAASSQSTLGSGRHPLLNDREKLKLNQIMGNAYSHIFAYVEEYIIPQALEAAQRDIYGDETRLRACCALPRTSRSTRSCFDARRRCSRRGSASSAA